MQVNWTVKKTSEFRDILVGEEMQKKADLGWFDEEFTMYGCAFYLREENKVNYIISPKAEEIYQFIEDACLENIYTSNVESLTRKCPVPSGLREVIANEVKIRLAKNIQKMYTKDFFEVIAQLDDMSETDDTIALALLEQEAWKAEGLFQKDLLKQFEATLADTRRRHCISKKSYENLNGWLMQEKRNFENDATCKERFEKTLFGLVQYNNDEEIVIINAQKEYIYMKYYELVAAGKNVSPIFSKTYWRQNGSALQEIKNCFREEIMRLYKNEYFSLLQQIREKNISEEVLEKTAQLLEEVKGKYGIEPYKSLARYAAMWGLISVQ